MWWSGNWSLRRQQTWKSFPCEGEILLMNGVLEVTIGLYQPSGVVHTLGKQKENKQEGKSDMYMWLWWVSPLLFGNSLWPKKCQALSF